MLRTELILIFLLALSGRSHAEESQNQPEKLIFQAPADAFDTLWDHLNTKVLQAEFPVQAPGDIFAVKRIRAGGLQLICIVNTNNQSQRQCDFYVENHFHAYRNPGIGGVIEFKGDSAKAIAAQFKLKELWHLTDNPLSPGKKIWRAGYAISRPEELFLWEFYYDGAQYYAHFSRIWHSHYYVFDMFERKSTKLFDPQTDSFPKKKVIYTGPAWGGGGPSAVDDLFMDGARESFFGGRRRSGIGG